MLRLQDGGHSFVIPEGEMLVPTVTTNLIFTRLDDNTTFTVQSATAHTSVTVGKTSAGILESQAMRENFYDGMLWGLSLMCCAIGLRMVKQLGYHSGDL